MLKFTWMRGHQFVLCRDRMNPKGGRGAGLKRGDPKFLQRFT